MLFVKKSLFTAFFIMIAATGVAFGLKAAVGVGAWDAFSQATSMVTGIKVGTFSMMMNLSCVLVQLVILKKDFQTFIISSDFHGDTARLFRESRLL
jgi:uncharacterized protein